MLTWLLIFALRLLARFLVFIYCLGTYFSPTYFYIAACISLFQLFLDIRCFLFSTLTILKSSSIIFFHLSFSRVFYHLTVSSYRFIPDFFKSRNSACIWVDDFWTYYIVYVLCHAKQINFCQRVICVSADLRKSDI